MQELGYYYQVQAAAVPRNASDPELVGWFKPASNPLQFEVPPGGTHAQFRDPITPYLQVTPPPRPLQHDPCSTHALRESHAREPVSDGDLSRAWD